jgi:hypothetical protein
MTIHWGSHRGPKEACYELYMWACVRSAAYCRFALLPKICNQLTWLTHLDHVLPANAGCVQPEACYSVQIASGQTIQHMRVLNYLSYLFRAMSDCELQFAKLRIHNHFNHWTLSFETYNLPGSSSPHWTNVCEVVMGMW